MECSHDYIIKDAYSENSACKITLCSKCLEVKKVDIRGEKPAEKKTEKSVWDAKDLRIARMSVLKVASELSIAREDYTLDTLFMYAQKLEDWVYRG